MSASDSDVRGMAGRRVHYLTVHTAPGATSRLNGLYNFRPYVYRGTGRDELTGWMDDEPGEAERLTRRQERIRLLAELRLHDGDGGPVPAAGFVTAREAAERLGVTVRTIERYKRHLRGGEAA
jgi:hypothetical protein